MTFGERLYQLRKQKYISQEELADMMNVSRQSISKWELDQTYPDIDNIIRLAEYFDVSVDYLVTGEEKITIDEPTSKNNINQDNEQINNKGTTSFSANNLAWHYEYKSKKTVRGVPLVHVNLGIGIYCAKGIIAIGNIAQGIVAIGGLSLGLIAIGGFGLGLIAFCGLAIGLLLAVGGVAASAVVGIGGMAIGTFAIGGVALGFHKAIGGVAIAKHPLGALNIYLGHTKTFMPLLKKF